MVLAFLSGTSSGLTLSEFYGQLSLFWINQNDRAQIFKIVKALGIISIDRESEGLCYY